ncbi:hypothetical protein D3C72_2050230 [compost metagenome]
MQKTDDRIARLLLCVHLHSGHALTLLQLPEDHCARQYQPQRQQHHRQFQQRKAHHVALHGLSPFTSSLTARFNVSANVSYNCAA